MIEREPSRTAWRAAAHRALHQDAEGGAIFADPLAKAILGADPAGVFGAEAADEATAGMRLMIAARSRFAEDALAAALARGVRDYVILGAGLDTFACRNPYAGLGLRVFEVDHPATQAWKRRRLAEAGMTPLPGLTFAPVDFERQTLADGLADAGLALDAPVFFSWLGVVVYLTAPVVMDTLASIAARPAPAEVVFDYSEPREAFAPEEQAMHQRRAARVAALGEPWITRFTPAALHADLTALGFDDIEDLDRAAIATRLAGRPGRKGPGPHLVRAARR